LQLFAHPKTSKCLSVVSVNIFEDDMAAEQKQAIAG